MITQNRKQSVSTTNTVHVFRGLMNGRWWIKWKPQQKSCFMYFFLKRDDKFFEVRSNHFTVNVAMNLRQPSRNFSFTFDVDVKTISLLMFKHHSVSQIPFYFSAHCRKQKNLCFLGTGKQEKRLLSLPNPFLYFKMATWNTGLALSHFKHFTWRVMFNRGEFKPPL